MRPSVSVPTSVANSGSGCSFSKPDPTSGSPPIEAISCCEFLRLSMFCIWRRQIRLPGKPSRICVVTDDCELSGTPAAF